MPSEGNNSVSGARTSQNAGQREESPSQFRPSDEQNLNPPGIVTVQVSPSDSVGQQSPTLRLSPPASLSSSSAATRAARAKSIAADSARHQQQQQQQTMMMRRNESAGHLPPERGQLRPFDEGQRLRSNTAGSGQQLMLNIRRSAWRLSDFDQTFRAPSDEFEGGGADSNYHLPPASGSGLAAKAKLSSARSEQNLVEAQRRFERQSSFRKSNLLLRAINSSSKRSPPVEQVAPSSGANVLCVPTQLNERSHSISSFDSFCSGCSTDKSAKFSFGVLHRHKRKRKHKPPAENNCAGDEAQDEEKCNTFDTLRQFVPALNWLPNYKWRQDFYCDLTAGLAVAVLNISTSMSAAVVAGTDFGVAFRSSIVNTFVYSLLCSSRHTSFGSWSIMSQMLLVSVRRALSDEYILSRINLMDKAPEGNWSADEYENWHTNLIVMYTFLIGLVQLLAGSLGLGNVLASFIPEALCSSMIAATAFTMAIGQLANMCGTTNKVLFAIERNTTELWAELKNPPVSIADLFAGTFRWMQQLALLAKYYEQINLVCVLISICAVVFLALNQYFVQVELSKLFKRNIFLPSELILLIIMTLVSYSLNLNSDFNVRTSGPIYVDLVAPNMPNLRLVRELWLDSLATAMISYTMTYIMAKTYSNKLNYDIDSNQELIACGAGNLFGGFFDALPATASFSRTAGQVEAGGKTQMASLINCLLLICSTKLLGEFVSPLPVCVMSATLFYGFARMMLRVKEAANYWRLCKVDFSIWLVTFVAILALDMLNGFLYGLMFSLLTVLYRAQNRRCYILGSIGSSSDVYVPLVKYPLAQELDGIKIFQFCGPIHYACADQFERSLRQKIRVNVQEILRARNEQQAANCSSTAANGKQLASKQEALSGCLKLQVPPVGCNREAEEEPPTGTRQPPTSHIILDFSMISFVDSAGVAAIKKIIEDYQKVGITVFLASLVSHVAAVLKCEPSLWDGHKDRIYVTLADAVHCATRDTH